MATRPSKRVKQGDDREEEEELVESESVDEENVANSSSEESGNVAGGAKLARGPWRMDEDLRLKDGVEQFGLDNWKKVSELVMGRTPKQCKDRYRYKLDPSINHGPWTKAEDQKLLELDAGEFSHQWTKIAQLLPGRTENAVKSRIASLKRYQTKEWSAEEDQKLRALKEQNKSFEEIAAIFNNHRTIHSLKKRWERLFMNDLADKIRQQKIPAPIIAPPPPPQATLLSNTKQQQQQQQTHSNPLHTVSSRLKAHNSSSWGDLPTLEEFEKASKFKNINILTGSSIVNNSSNNNNSSVLLNGTALNGVTSQVGKPPQANPKSRLNRQSTSMTILLQAIGEGEGFSGSDIAAAFGNHQ